MSGIAWSAWLGRGGQIGSELGGQVGPESGGQIRRIIQVHALVLDTIKGKYYTAEPCPALALKKSFDSSGNEVRATENETKACPIIEFTTDPRLFDRIIDERLAEFGKHAPPELTDSLGNLRLTIDETMIVALKMTDLQMDNAYDYMHRDITLTNFGPLPFAATNSMVHDGNHVWSNSDYISYSSLKLQMQGILNKLMQMR